MIAADAGPNALSLLLSSSFYNVDNFLLLTIRGGGGGPYPWVFSTVRAPSNWDRFKVYSFNVHSFKMFYLFNSFSRFTVVRSHISITQITVIVERISSWIDHTSLFAFTTRYNHPI